METRVLRMPVMLPENGECDRCLERLRDAVLQIAGVEKVQVDPQAHQVTLAYDPRLLTLEDVRRKAERIGVELSESIAHQKLDLVGMDCPDCGTKLENAVGRLPGVFSAEVNFAASRMLVEYEAGKVSLPQIVDRIESLGYGIEGGSLGELEHPLVAWWRRHKLWVTTGLSGLLLLAGYTTELAGGSPEAARLLFGLSIASGGLYMARSVLSSLLSAGLDTNFLMLLAAVGAAVIGQWAEGAIVVFLYSLGNSLESLTIERTRASIRSLMALAPPTALVLRDGEELEQPVESVQVGQILRVKPGASIPLDGVVLRGQSSVNQAAITGESMPAVVMPGSPVFAGSLNQEGSLEVRVEKRYQETALARIIHLVEEAQAQKAPVQRFTEAFGRIYTPSIIALAVVSGIVVPMAFSHSGDAWFRKALTLLVVACPCALVISTPVAVAAAIGRAARQGVLIKGGAHLELLSSVKVVAFDKTGTLTKGKPVVSDVVGLAEPPETVLSLAAAVERHSEHPVAGAVLAEAGRRGLRIPEATDFRAVPGRGAEATVEGRHLYAGNRAYMEDLGLSTREGDLHAEGWQSQGRTAIYLAEPGRVLGLVAVEDEVREGAAAAVAALRKLGVPRIVMLTGDDEGPARAVASRVGIEDVRYRLLPEQKVDVVRALGHQYGRVAMVGDGINDAPALAAATVGIAMGAAGTDTALETADIALMGDELEQIPFAFRLSRRALRVIHQNIGFALVVVALLVGTTLFQGLRLSLGVAGHEGSALLVIANGMRLLNHGGSRAERG